ncbi:MAG: hypothetical protein V1708_00625 [Candidatus Micrarchaeota archaeon]
MALLSWSFKGFVESVLRLPQDIRDKLYWKARSFYTEPDWCDYPPLGMYLLGVARHACSSENLTRFYAELQNQSDEIRPLLGFKRLPSYSALAHFFNTRVAKRASELVDEGRKLLEQACQKAGLQLGEIRSTDGKVMASTHREAEFNPHYKKKMFKGVIDWDLVLLAPLKSVCTNGLADERPHAKKSHDELAHLKTKLDVLDGGYYAFQLYCLNSHTPTLIYFPEGTTANEDPAKELEKTYRKCWKDSAYKVGATLGNQIKFLLAKEEFEAVGRYYRDLQVLESVTAPAEYQRKKHRRSLVETGNSLLDNRGLSNRVKHASFKQAERDLHWTCHALQIQRVMKMYAA